VVPKITPFMGNSDPEAHLKSFQALMLILGETDVVRCKMFVSTLAKIVSWNGLELSLMPLSSHLKSSHITFLNDSRPIRQDLWRWPTCLMYDSRETSL